MATGYGGLANSLAAKERVALEQSYYNQESVLHDLPLGASYEELSTKQKILHTLNEVTLDAETYPLAHTELTDFEIRINPREFTREACKNKPTLFYDPRFTLSVYLNEIKRQYLKKNPKNLYEKVDEIEVPFSWQDWIDLTDLNPLISGTAKINCEYLRKRADRAPENADYCVDSKDVTEYELKEMRLPLKSFLPGFVIKKPPGNLATNEVRMIEGKTHLLTYAPVPLNIMFLTKRGVYEARVAPEKQRLVDSDLFENYLELVGYRGHEELIVLNPVAEFYDLIAKVEPDTTLAEDVFGMTELMMLANVSNLREIHVPKEAFDYRQDKIDKQLRERKEEKARFAELNRKEGNSKILSNLKREDDDEVSTSQIEVRAASSDVSKIGGASNYPPGGIPGESRQKTLYYASLEYANQFTLQEEPTYYHMARLKYDETNKVDAGWHYEWRFFNGALRYLKKGWTEDELLVRKKIVLDRILRNWFRFATERGILSYLYLHGIGMDSYSHLMKILTFNCLPMKLSVSPNSTTKHWWWKMLVKDLVNFSLIVQLLFTIVVNHTRPTISMPDLSMPIPDHISILPGWESLLNQFLTSIRMKLPLLTRRRLLVRFITVEMSILPHTPSYLH